MALNEVYLGLGSNVDDPVSNIERAIEMLRQHSRSLAVSRLYRTTPQGFRNQPDFVNAVCRIWTDLDPFQLLEVALQIEQAVGRSRTFINAPRALDIDLLMYGNQVMQGPPLTLPHPRMHMRSFVLRPLLDIAPGLVHPVMGSTIEKMWEELSRSGDLISPVERAAGVKPDR